MAINMFKEIMQNDVNTKEFRKKIFLTLEQGVKYVQS